MGWRGWPGPAGLGPPFCRLLGEVCCQLPRAERPICTATAPARERPISAAPAAAPGAAAAPAARAPLAATPIRPPRAKVAAPPATRAAAAPARPLSERAPIAAPPACPTREPKVRSELLALAIAGLLLLLEELRRVEASASSPPSWVRSTLPTSRAILMHIHSDARPARPTSSPPSRCAIPPEPPTSTPARLLSLISSAPTANVHAHSSGSARIASAALTHARATCMPLSVGASASTIGPVAYSSAPARMITTFMKISASSVSPTAPITSTPPNAQPATIPPPTAISISR